MSYRILIVINSESRRGPEFMTRNIGVDEFRQVPVDILQALDVDLEQFSLNLITGAGFRARQFVDNTEESLYRTTLSDHVWTINHNGTDGIMIVGNDGRDDFFIYKINC